MFTPKEFWPLRPHFVSFQIYERMDFIIAIIALQQLMTTGGVIVILQSNLE